MCVLIRESTPTVSGNAVEFKDENILAPAWVRSVPDYDTVNKEQEPLDGCSTDSSLLKDLQSSLTCPLRIQHLEKIHLPSLFSLVKINGFDFKESVHILGILSKLPERKNTNDTDVSYLTRSSRKLLSLLKQRREDIKIMDEAAEVSKTSRDIEAASRLSRIKNDLMSGNLQALIEISNARIKHETSRQNFCILIEEYVAEFGKNSNLNSILKDSRYMSDVFEIVDLLAQCVKWFGDSVIPYFRSQISVLGNYDSGQSELLLGKIHKEVFLSENENGIPAIFRNWEECEDSPSEVIVCYKSKPKYYIEDDQQ